jgi:hypothetical protein
MKQFPFLGMFLSLFSATSFADNQAFVQAYLDNDGVSWSEPLAQKMPNGCTNSQGTHDPASCSPRNRSGKDSQAQAACETLDARLPTVFEIERLVMNFDHTKTDQWSFPELIDLGLQQYKAAFKNVTDDNFYSSTVTQKWRPDSTHGFSEKYGKVVYLDRNSDPRFFPGSVVSSVHKMPIQLPQMESSSHLGPILLTPRVRFPSSLPGDFLMGLWTKPLRQMKFPFYKHPLFAAWHRFRSGLPLNYGTALIIVQSGYNGGGAYRLRWRATRIGQ